MASLVIDKRILHVANPYAEWEHASPAQIMKQAHDRIRDKYQRTAMGQAGVGAGSAEEANELNEFFQAIKIYQYNPDSDFLAGAKKQVVNSILEKALAMRGHGTKHLLNMDKGTGQERGAAAERDIAIIMQSVFNELSGSNSKDYGKLILGGAQVNVNTGAAIDPASLDKFAQAMIQAGAKRVYDKVMKQPNDRFIQVQGKIDVSGAMADVRFDINADPYLLRIGELLNKASFSIKSYASKGAFDQELKQRLESKVTKLHLGHTDQRRIFSDIFGAMGVPHKVALSMLHYTKKTKNKTVKKEAANLIFVYELTGYGQKYVNQAINDVLTELGIDGANYFIYNDPSTNNIFVRSTAELITTMWNHVDEILEKGATSLQKSIFYST